MVRAKTSLAIFALAIVLGHEEMPNQGPATRPDASIQSINLGPVVTGSAADDRLQSMSDASRPLDSISSAPKPGALSDVIQRAEAQLLSVEVTSDLLNRTLAEDEIELGDVTTQSMIGVLEVLVGSFVARQSGVLAGLQPLIKAIGQTKWSSDISIEPALADGDRVAAGQEIALVTGKSGVALELERSVLNLLCLGSGVASLTSKFVEAVAHTKAVICGTRKTIPGLRAWQKYAVICGGGEPHRMSLADAAMFKDNHLAGIKVTDLADRVRTAAREARRSRPLKFVSVEIDTLDQLKALLDVEDGLVDIALLDNMSVDRLADCVALRDQSRSHLQLEATGNVTLANVAELAESGVDRISTGAITHSAQWLDIGFDIDPKAALRSGAR